jgi:hypothetical protein
VKLIILLVAALFVLVQCTANDEAPPLTVWSNDPDAAFFMERYQLETGTPVRFRFVHNLTEELTQQRVDADLVIGRWINNPPVHNVLRDLPEGTPLRPMAFSLGAVVFLPPRIEPLPPFQVTLNDLGAGLRPRGSGMVDPVDLEPMRFTLANQPALLYHVLRMSNMAPVPDAVRHARWDAQLHDQGFQIIRDWQNRWNNGPEEEQLYVERFLYEPWFRLLDTGRVLAVYKPSQELFSWYFFEEENWDFRWVADEHGDLLALENVVYGGIPISARRRSEAQNLLNWLHDPTVQVQLVQDKLDHKVDTFGLFGGFSLHQETNERIAQEIRPILMGRIPDPSTVQIPAPRPRYWDEAREQVVEPFLTNAVRRNNPPDGAALAQSLARWYNQRGD